MGNHSNFISEPIFLVGADRSGTTVTRLMLAHHPQLALCNELSYTVEKVSETGEYPPLEEHYELSGLPPLELNTVTEKLVRLKDWWGRFLFRLDRYGLGLLVSNHLSRILGIKQWYKQVKTKINHIEQTLIQTSEQRKIEQKQLHKTASTL